MTATACGTVNCRMRPLCAKAKRQGTPWVRTVNYKPRKLVCDSFEELTKEFAHEHRQT